MTQFYLFPMTYQQLFGSSTASISGINTKHGERIIDLAVGGWSYVTNVTDLTANLSGSIALARGGAGLETRVDDIAYLNPGARIDPSGKTLYRRGLGVQ